MHTRLNAEHSAERLGGKTDRQPPPLAVPGHASEFEAIELGAIGFVKLLVWKRRRLGKFFP